MNTILGDHTPPIVAEEREPPGQTRPILCTTETWMGKSPQFVLDSNSIISMAVLKCRNALEEVIHQALLGSWPLQHIRL